MKALATLFAIAAIGWLAIELADEAAAIGWLAIVTFCGPELYRVINGPEPVKSKAVRSHR